MISRTKFIIAGIALLVTGLFLHLHAHITVPLNKPFAEFPGQHKGWQMRSESLFSESVLKVLKPTDYMYRKYDLGNELSVYLYIGYHGGGKDTGPIHSPKHCMPGGGWYEASEETVTIDAGGVPLELVKTVYQKGGEKELFLYWYQVKGRALSDEYSLKAFEIINSMMHRRRDSAFIRISVPFTHDPEKAYAAGVRFIKDFYPLITDFLPK